MITILLTSYNRPNFIRRTLASLLAQTSPNWHCVILDDNSNAETLAAIHEFTYDPRFDLRTHDTTQEERQTTVRYSALINVALPEFRTGLVGYLCDNVEYDPALVDTVERYFELHPETFAGFVYHRRDMWTPDGLALLGTAAQYGHWDYTPPDGQRPVREPFGNLDHSQVFHRLPTDLRWTTDPQFIRYGDGQFFTQLVEAHGPIQPIAPGVVLTLEHLVK